jgi:hypothetical protein
MGAKSETAASASAIAIVTATATATATRAMPIMKYENLRATELQFMECEVTAVMRDCVLLAQLDRVNWSRFVYTGTAAPGLKDRRKGTSAIVNQRERGC